MSKQRHGRASAEESMCMKGSVIETLGERMERSVETSFISPQAGIFAALLSAFIIVGTSLLWKFRSIQALPNREASSVEDLRKKIIVYRVRGLLSGFNKEDVAKVVVRVFSLPIDQAVRIRSLADDPNREGEMIAIVEISGNPQNYLGVSGGEHKDAWSFQLPDKSIGRHIIFDTHFRGWTPLYCENKRDCVIDVVAVSGLGSHAFGSFKEKDKPFMWLGDALPGNAKSARILIYGYDTQLKNSASFATLNDLGRGLMAAIKSMRNYPRAKEKGQHTASPERPLILIGHSLGGLLIKSAILQMSRGDDSDKANLKSIRGMLFFGVPNQGMPIEQLYPIVGDGPNRQLIEQLGKASDTLREFGEQFRRKFTYHDSTVYSFYETKLSPLIGITPDGTLKQQAERVVLVDRASAIHGRPWEEDGRFVIPINRTHTELVKFSSHDDDLQIVLACLHDLIHDACYVIRKRFPSEGLERFISNLSPEESECLKSLAFPEMTTRFEDLRPDPNTCAWLLKNPVYQKWLYEPQGLVLIKGKPGSGKSVLMKFATEQAIKENSQTSIITSYFFHGRGVLLQRTLLGLLRTLLHDILRQCPRQCGTLMSKYRNKCLLQGESFKRWSWHEGELQDCLRQVITTLPEDLPLFIYVDALDEGDTEKSRDLVFYFDELIQMAGPERSVKICYSHREYPIISPSRITHLSVDKENEGDMKVYLRRKWEILGWRPDQTVLSIENLMLKKAQGVFLWIELVWKKARRLHLEGNPETFQHVVEETPIELDNLYVTLLPENTQPEEFAQARKLFQWVCFSKEPLELVQLQEAILLDPQMKQTSMGAYRWMRHQRDEEQIRKRVVHLSRGLVEIKVMRKAAFAKKTGPTDNPEYSVREWYDDVSVVQLIHQSVWDFLLRYGFAALDVPATNVVGWGHFEISRCCIRYLSMDEMKELKDYPETGNRKNEWLNYMLRQLIPLLEYSVRYWVSHAEAVERTGIPQDDLLALLQWPSRQILELFEKWASNIRQTMTRSSPPTTLLHICAAEGLNSVLDAIIKNDHTSSICNDMAITLKPEQPPCCNRESPKKPFLENGHINFDIRDGFGITPLCLSVKSNQLKIARRLLQIDHVDPLSTDEEEGWRLRSTLGAAAAQTEPEMLRIFLEGLRTRFMISESTVKEIVKHLGSGAVGLQTLLQECGPQFRITQETLEAAAENQSSEAVEILRMLTKTMGPNLQITENVLVSAAQRMSVGADMMKFLLQERRSHVTITEAVLIAAASHKLNDEAINLMLQEKNPDWKITENVLLAAMGSRGLRNETMELLLEAFGPETEITERMLIAAARYYPGNKMIRFLLREGRSHSAITEAVIIAAAENTSLPFAGIDIISFLLDERGAEIVITEAVLVAAARNRSGEWLLRHLIHKRGQEVTITEAVVTAAVRNSVASENILEFLLQARGAEIVITEEVLVAVVSFGSISGNGLGAMKTLIKKGGSEIVITPRVLEAALANGRVWKLLIQERPSEVQITGSMIRHLAPRDYSGNWAYVAKSIVKTLVKQKTSEISMSSEVDEIFRDDLLSLNENAKEDGIVRRVAAIRSLLEKVGYEIQD